MTADLRRLVKNCGDAVDTLVCMRGKEITKKNTKNGSLHRDGYISPLVQCLPLNP